MILTISGIILSLILCLCFINIKWGTALFLAYSILVPIWDITLGPIHIGDNFVKTILLLALLYDFRILHKYKFSWKLLSPFLIYYTIELVVIPFQYETPLLWMLNSFRVSVMSVLFESMVVYNVLVHYPQAIKLYRNALVVSIFVAALYGIYLTTTAGVNPYIMGILLVKESAGDAEKMLTYFSAGDRLFGRISSVFLHPMTFGLFIGLSFIYIYAIRAFVKKWICFILFILLILDALFCGVRSCIGGLAVAISVYLITSKNVRVGIIILILGFLGYTLISGFPELSDYVGSIADIHNTNSNVSGSSVEMRLDQLSGCFEEIRNSPIIGKGYDWHNYYQSLHGDHPKILAFESLSFIVICDNGLLGIVIWAFIIFFILKHNHRSHLNDVAIIDSLFVFYISYSCITGEYGYMQYFLLFYICAFFDNKKIEIKGK